MDNVRHKVIVRKSNAPMMKGESLDMFTSELSKSAREHVLMKLNIVKGNGGGWPVEIFADKVVYGAYKGDDSTRYYAFTYKRDKNGTFSFGDLVEVQRITSYVPKKQSVLKAKVAKPDMEDEEEKGCSGKPKKGKVPPQFLSKKPTKKSHLWEFDGWRQTEKSFWGGAL